MTNDDGAGAPHEEKGNTKPLEGRNPWGVAREGCEIYSKARGGIRTGKTGRAFGTGMQVGTVRQPQC